MNFNTGTFTAQNNMVRVGLGANASSTAVASTVRGIFDNGTDAGRNFYHNSVYLGGTQTSGASNTFAFNSAGISNARDFRNNLFVNARSKSGGTGKHYAVQYGGTAANPTGLTATNNLFYAPNTASGGVFGFFASADRTTLAAWQSATGVDANSLNADPLFVAPAGTSATVDLHIATNSPALNVGATGLGVADDFDGQTRDAAPDIGADEFASSNASLSALTLSAGALNPAFDANTLAYTLAVPNGTASTTVTATRADANATLQLQRNGGGFTALPSGTPSSAQAFKVGSNTLDVKVTAQDGTTVKTYTVAITRNTAFQDWAAANGVSSDPNTLGTNGLANVLNFAFGINPNGTYTGSLVINGTFAGGGTITTPGQPFVMLEQTAFGVDYRAVFARRKNWVAAGLTYTVQFSADLSNWEASAEPPVVIASDAEMDAVTVPYPFFLSTGEKAQFFRVQVSIQ